MNPPTIAQADSVYQIAQHGDSRPLAVSLTVSDEAFRRFALGLREFENRLGPAAEDEFWTPLLRRLKRHRFEWSATPLRFSDGAFGSPDTARLFAQMISLCRSVQPAYLPALDRLQETFSSVAGSHANPLGDALRRLLGERPTADRLALLMNVNRLVREVRTKLLTTDPLSALKSVTGGELGGETCYELLVVIGAPGWFPPHIFSAPRAFETQVVHYDWMRIRIDKNPLFLSSGEGEPEAVASQPAEQPTVGGAPAIKYLQSDEVLPRIDWSAISSNLAPAHEQGDIESTTESRLVLLANGFGAFLDIAEHAYVYVIDPEAPDLERIRRVRTAELAPGMYVLLRSEGGGDYVASIANTLLGDQAAKLRAIQQEWKGLLRKKVQDKSISEVSAQLRAMGLQRASEANLRNWMSETSLRTEDPADFNTIMRFLDLQKQAKTYWQAMEILDRAHRKAGFHIRRLLIREVLQADFRELEGEGRMNFELADADGGSLTAFRVERISPDTSHIAHFRVGRPFKVEPDLWQG